MKVYTFGDAEKPAVLLLPGTCCHWESNIRAAYGCSLGGSFVGLLAARGNIRMDFGILGGSDLNQASPLPRSSRQSSSCR